MKMLPLVLLLLVLSTNIFAQTRSSAEIPFEWTLITTLVNANSMIGKARKTENYTYVGLCQQYIDFAQSQLDYLKARKEIDSKYAISIQDAINDLRNTKEELNQL